MVKYFYRQGGLFLFFLLLNLNCMPEFDNMYDPDNIDFKPLPPKNVTLKVLNFDKIKISLDYDFEETNTSIFILRKDTSLVELEKGELHFIDRGPFEEDTTIWYKIFSANVNGTSDTIFRYVNYFIPPRVEFICDTIVTAKKITIKGKIFDASGIKKVSCVNNDHKKNFKTHKKNKREFDFTCKLELNKGVNEFSVYVEDNGKYNSDSTELFISDTVYTKRIHYRGL